MSECQPTQRLLFGQDPSGPHSNRILNDKTEKKLAAMYRGGMSADRISAKTGINRGTVYSAIRRQGVAMRVRTRRRKLNEHALDDPVGNPRAAYFSGLLFTDGCVLDGESTPVVAIALQRKDRCLLVAYRSFLGSTHTIGNYSGVSPSGQPTKYCSIHVCSKLLADALAKVNVVPRKSHIATVAASMAFNRHWWRGCVDGDGWVCISTDGVPYIGYCGTHSACEAFLAFCRTVTPTRSTVLRNGSVWKAVLNGHHAVRLARHLYPADEVALPRKKLKAEEMIARWSHVPDLTGEEIKAALEEEPFDWHPYPIPLLIAMRGRYDSWKHVARTIGVTIGSMRWHLDRHRRKHAGGLCECPLCLTYAKPKLTLGQAESLSRSLGTIAAAAKSLGIRAATLATFIRRARQRLGLPPFCDRFSWKGKTLEWAIALVQEHGSQEAAARAIGATKDKLNNFIARSKTLRGIPVKERHDWEGTSLEEIRELIRTAGSHSEAAKRYGVTRCQLRNRLYRLQALSRGLNR